MQRLRSSCTSSIVHLHCLQINFSNNSIGLLLNDKYGLKLPPWPSKLCTLVVRQISDLLQHHEPTRSLRSSICHFHCFTGNSVIILSTFNPAFSCLQSLYWQSIFNCQRCHVHMQGDVTRNMYRMPAVSQRIFNQLIIRIWHWLVDINLFWAFWWKLRDSTANGCKMMVH